MAWERLILLDEAKRKKITITNQDLVKFISTHPLFQKNGVFDNAVYTTLIRNTLSLLPRDFEEYVRENLAVQTVRQEILKDINVSEEEIIDFYNMNFGQINCSYILVDDSLLPPELDTTEADLKEYYELHKDNFYDPAQVQIEYIEIPYSSTAENEQARKKLTSLYSKLISGDKTFRETALENGVKYSKPDIFSSENLLPEVPFFREFYETAFTLNKDEISPSIYSHPEKGSAYIIHKIENYPRQYKSYDEMKNALKDPALEKKRLALSKQKADELYTEMLTQGLSLEELSDEYNLRIKTSGQIGFDGYIENFGPTRNLLSKMENVAEGETIASVVSLKGVIIPRLDKRFPPEEKDFAEKKDRIKNLLLVRKQTKALDEWFNSKKTKVQLQADIKEL